MSDKSIQYASLHEVNLAKRRQLYKKNNKLMAFTAKALEVKGTQGVLADSTEGDLVEGQTYDVLVSLSINKYHLIAQVVSATLSSETISSIGSENFSGKLIDQNSVKPIVTIKSLLEARIGQSFFAKILEIKREDNLISVVLGDSTARVEAEIETSRKQISKDILDNLNTTQVYLCSDMVLRFNSTNNLVGRFNYSSNITLASDHTISSIGDLNISASKYSDEEQKSKISDILRIHERQEDSQPKQFHKKYNSKYQHNYKEQQHHSNQDKQYPTYHQQQQKQQQPQYQPQNHHQNTNNSNQDVPLTIDQLEPWNNNQTFIGKILTVNIVNSGEPKNITYLKGTVGDSTGVIDFDMGQKRGLILKENDVVKFESAMNKVIDGRHFIDVKKYGSYTILNNYKISSINKSNNLSSKSVPSQGESNITQQQKNVKPVQIDYNSPVKINQLILRNNRQTFLAKILSVNEEQQTNKYNDETETHFIGTAADETGLIEFDVIEQNDVLIKQGDVVRFENGLNHFDDGKHVVKIYRKGIYEIVSNVQIKLVNTTPNNPQQRNNSQQNRSHSWSNHNSHHDKPYGEYKNQVNTNQRYKSKDNQNYNSDRYENESHQRSYNTRGNYQHGSKDNNRYSKPSYQNNRENYHSESRNERPSTITDICDLVPGEHGQNIIGEVFELNQVTKDLNGRVVTFLKGRIGDATANIRFDFSQKDQLKVGQVYHLKNITNKVDEDGFHYVTLGKFSHYNLAQKNNLSSVNTGEGESNNLSSIEYVKKTVRTEQQ